MHNINFIRENPIEFDNAMKQRGEHSLSKKILEIDEQKRNTQTLLQNLLAERNTLSKEIGKLKTEKKDAASELTKVDNLKKEISNFKKETGIDIIDLEDIDKFNDFEFCVLDHEKGNGGCLMLSPNEISADKGIMVYMNVDGRIQDPMSKVEPGGGKVLETTHQIGQHGFRSVILDSEGNRIVLHSNTDA